MRAAAWLPEAQPLVHGPELAPQGPHLGFRGVRRPPFITESGSAVLTLGLGVPLLGSETEAREETRTGSRGRSCEWDRRGRRKSPRVHPLPLPRTSSVLATSGLASSAEGSRSAGCSLVPPSPPVACYSPPSSWLAESGCTPSCPDSPWLGADGKALWGWWAWQGRVWRQGLEVSLGGVGSGGTGRRGQEAS